MKNNNNCKDLFDEGNEPGTKMLYEVQIPNLDGTWDTGRVFRNRANAIKYLKDIYGADDRGCVCILGELEVMDDDDILNDFEGGKDGV